VLEPAGLTSVVVPWGAEHDSGIDRVYLMLLTVFPFVLLHFLLHSVWAFCSIRVDTFIIHTK